MIHPLIDFMFKPSWPVDAFKEQSVNVVLSKSPVGITIKGIGGK